MYAFTPLFIKKHFASAFIIAFCLLLLNKLLLIYLKFSMLIYSNVIVTFFQWPEWPKWLFMYVPSILVILFLIIILSPLLLLKYHRWPYDIKNFIVSKIWKVDYFFCSLLGDTTSSSWNTWDTAVHGSHCGTQCLLLFSDKHCQDATNGIFKNPLTNHLETTPWQRQLNKC